jgi:hypothetical protein
MDGGVPVAGAGHQAPVPAADITHPLGLGRRRDLRGAVQPVALACGHAGLARQAAAVGGDRFLGVFAQVVPQMPAIGDLDRPRRALARTVGVTSSPVTADNLRTPMSPQPRRPRRGFPVGQQVNCLAGSHIDHDGGIDPPLPEGEVIHAGHLRRRADPRLRKRSDQPQQRRPVHRRTQNPGQPGPRPAGQHQPDLGQ